MTDNEYMEALEALFEKTDAFISVLFDWATPLGEVETLHRLQHLRDVVTREINREIANITEN